MQKHTQNGQPYDTLGRAVRYRTLAGMMVPNYANNLNWQKTNITLFDGTVREAPSLGVIVEYEIIK